MVAAGVTGSAIAIPLLGAAGAHAADATTWDRVALCETGGIWSADLGNGYYGGLQFSQDTWDQYGGGQYASRPDLASRSQQIAVAEKVYAAEGAKPWLSCATVSGLTKDDAATATVDPGVPDTASPTPSDEASDEASDDASASATPSDSVDGAHTGSDAGSDTSSASPSDAPTAAATDPAADSGSGSGSDAAGSRRSSDADSPEPTDSATPSDPASASTGTPAPSRSATTGKHRGDEANEPSHDARAGDDNGRHASRSESPTRGDARSDDSYTVRPGDNLSAIADAHDLPGGWPALYAANHRTIGGDPDLILPGQALDLSPKQG
ncbi:transglycosylase family protein [Streptomyces sp. NPDC051320]|uniref:transglycosylase family protein n=1 Tax=Streptomyces sp. NPDC051320 TaxID=3154644 RepID=UPI0034200EB7